MKSSITIKSEQLNPEDLHDLLQAIRSCEMSSFPEKLISISMTVPEMSTKAMEMLLKSIEPPYDMGPVVIKMSPEVRPTQGLKVVQALWLAPGGATPAPSGNLAAIVQEFEHPTDRTIGVIICEDQLTHTHKAYIGVGTGEDEAWDTKRIMERGGTFPVEMAELILKALKGGQREGKRKG